MDLQVCTARTAPYIALISFSRFSLDFLEDFLRHFRLTVAGCNKGLRGPPDGRTEFRAHNIAEGSRAGRSPATGWMDRAAEQEQRRQGLRMLAIFGPFPLHALVATRGVGSVCGSDSWQVPGLLREHLHVADDMEATDRAGIQSKR